MKNTIFAEKTFTDCLLLPCQRTPCPKIWRRKLSRIATKLRNSWNFSPSKISHYMVLICDVSRRTVHCTVKELFVLMCGCFSCSARSSATFWCTGSTFWSMCCASVGSRTPSVVSRCSPELPLPPSSLDCTSTDGTHKHTFFNLCVLCLGILHVILGCTTCHARVYYMSCSGILHVILGYTTCHTWVYCMSYLGILHVILGIKIVLFLCCFSIGFGLLVRLILEKTFDYSFNC